MVYGGEVMVIDPICKMNVGEKIAKYTSEYKGKKYHFSKIRKIYFGT
jgi:YHS domain-containing protein